VSKLDYLALSNGSLVKLTSIMISGGRPMKVWGSCEQSRGRTNAIIQLLGEFKPKLICIRASGGSNDTHIRPGIARTLVTLQTP
jgi:hypothetical protein